MERWRIAGLLLFSLGLWAGPSWAQNDHYPQFMRMGNTAYNNQNYDLAKEYYENAIDDYSDCWEAYVGLGNYYFAKKNLKEALKNYEQALKMNQDNPTLARFIQALKAKMGVLPPPTATPVLTAPPPLPAPGQPPPLPLPGK